MRTCTIDGCQRKHIAKGTCGTHYNKAHYTTEQRHPKIEQPCHVCGALTVKHRASSGRRVVCSNDCRYVATYGRPKRTPSREIVGPMPASCAITTPKPVAPPALRFVSACCQWCASPFVQDLRVTTTPMRYCSRRCAKARARSDRKAREHGATGTFTLAELVRLWLAFDKCCAYCEQPTDGLPDPDHVVPLSRGGSNSVTNILPSCRACNTDKNDMTLDEWPADRTRRGLPPRTTAWADSDQRVRHLVACAPTRPRWLDISRAA